MIAYNTSEYSSILGIHPQTLRRLTREGKIQCERTPGNHRRFFVEDRNDEKQKVAYARVSSHDQKSDLERQKEVLQERVAPDVIISDIGSGINYKKKGFKQLVTMLLTGKVKELVLTYKDRLLRFGSEIIFMMCKTLGIKVTILYEEEIIEPAQQMMKDFLAFMTVYAAKMHGQRSHRNKKAIKEALNAQV